DGAGARGVPARGLPGARVCDARLPGALPRHRRGLLAPAVAGPVGGLLARRDGRVGPRGAPRRVRRGAPPPLRLLRPLR
ncbi:hypothetical protein DQE84_19625, partial [Staphylococcus warneri]